VEGRCHNKCVAWTSSTSSPSTPSTTSNTAPPRFVHICRSYIDIARGSSLSSLTQLTLYHPMASKRSRHRAKMAARQRKREHYRIARAYIRDTLREIDRTTNAIIRDLRLGEQHPYEDGFTSLRSKEMNLIVECCYARCSLGEENKKEPWYDLLEEYQSKVKELVGVTESRKKLQVIVCTPNMPVSNSLLIV
jgi:hypothetical protein